MGRKKKGVTIAALDYSASVIDNYSENEISTLKARRMLVNAYRSGYEKSRRDFNKRAISAIELIQSSDFEKEHSEVLSQVKQLLFHNQI